MKMLVKVVMVIGMMLAAINVTNAQQGPKKNMGYGRGPGHGNGMMVQRLNLTEDQQATLRSMRLKMQKEMLPLRNKLGEYKAKMRTLSTVDNVDMKALNKLIDESSKLRADMAKLRVAHHQEVRKILTEEQRLQFDIRGSRGVNKQGCQKFGNGRISGQGKGTRTGK